MARHDFDLLVLGSGPAGQKAAIQAAKLGRRAAIAEQRRVIGGVCVNTGTIPSKTMREAVIHLTGMVHRAHTVFNYPTLAESYKVAALDALNKMRAMSRVMATRKAA